MMNETDLIELGFVKNVISEAEAGGKPYFYYTWEPYENSEISLISTSNDEADKFGGWWVEVFDFQDVRIKNLKELSDLITIIKNNIHKNES